MEHTLPPLPFKVDALEPYFSVDSLETHYAKHHRIGIDRLNVLLKDSEFEDMNLEDVIKKSCGDVFNQAAEVWNHNFYWHCLRPMTEGSTRPSGQLADVLAERFGSVAQFREIFNDLAINLVGSGWVWLVMNSAGELRIETTRNAETPVMWSNKFPLLACDMWEHAYYLDYRNSRPDYLDAFWHLVNWKFVAHNYAQHLAKSDQSVAVELY